MQTSATKRAWAFYALLPAILLAFQPAKAQQPDSIPLKPGLTVNAIEIDNGSNSIRLNGRPATDSSLRPYTGLKTGEQLKGYNIVIDYDANRIYLKPAVSIYTGRYILADKAVITISLKNGQLWGKKQNGNEVVLEPSGTDRFLLRDLQLNLEFLKDTGGTVRRLKVYSGERSLEAEKATTP